jgi:hypothetical protein
VGKLISSCLLRTASSSLRLGAANEANLFIISGFPRHGQTPARTIGCARPVCSWQPI